MTNQPQHDPQDQQQGTGDDTWVDARADRPPTDEEARAAEQAAADVDVDRVAENYESMAELGADVRGEGQIEPAAD